MVYRLLADALVAVHAAYVGFVVLGFLAILVGAALGWRWVRNFWFRVIHLTTIVAVGIEAVFGCECPLTIWEHDLRVAAGEKPSDGTFVGRIMHDLIFVDASPAVLNAAHIALALIVLATVLLIPPRWPWRRPRDEQGISSQ